MQEEIHDRQTGPGSAEGWLAAIISSSDDAIVSKDLGGTITSWNPAAERIFGYPASEAVGSHITLIIPPERGAEEIDILARIKRGERIEHFETVRMRKDGRRINVSVTISPIIADGRIVGASKIARDITTQKQVELALLEERARLEVTLASIGDGVIVTDAEGRVTFINAVAEALTGWMLDDARGQPIETVFHIVNERSRHRVESPVARALRDGIIVGLANHTILISRDGAERAIDDSAAPIRQQDGTPVGAVLVFRDVTDSRTAHEHRVRLAAIVESSDDAIISKDLAGRITSWNQGAARLFEYSEAEVLGRPISILIPPDRLEEEAEIIKRLRRGERIDHFETERVRKDGRTVEVSITISPIHDAEGVVVGASKIARDISERKRAETELLEARAELKRHSEMLEMNVAERTAELRDALAQLETYSYSISHDLRAPLRAIAGFLDLALTDYRDQLPEGARELIERAMRASTRLTGLVADVLSNAQRRLLPSELKPVALAELVPTVIDDYPNLRDQRHTIHVQQPLHPVTAVESLITQSVANLLANALKFSAQPRAPRVDIWTERMNGMIRLHVRDNGKGIPPEDQARIFELFYRGTNAGGSDGNGLGLAIVKRAVSRMGGQVGVSSAPGEGADFWLDLPAAEVLQP